MRTRRRLGAAALVALAALAFSGCAIGWVRGPATDLTINGATIDANLSSSIGGPTEYRIDYGPSTTYGESGPTLSVDLPKGEPVAVRIPVWPVGWSGTWAAPGVVHYRICARDREPNTGYACSKDATYQPPPGLSPGCVPDSSTPFTLRYTDFDPESQEYFLNNGGGFTDLTVLDVTKTAIPEAVPGVQQYIWAKRVRIGSPLPPGDYALASRSHEGGTTPGTFTPLRIGNCPAAPGS